MSATPAPRQRRRRRRGSLERPVSGRTYRGTWLLVALPLLLAAFTVTRPPSLPQPNLPPAFDTRGARELATELARTYPDRSPGTTGAAGAATWFADQLRPYGFAIESDRFRARVPGRGELPFTNLLAVAPGRSPEAIVVAAHRDNTGAGAGANDNASGTAALIELARSYGNPAGGSTAPSTSQRVQPERTIVFLSTDGGAFGGAGAKRFAESSRFARDVVAVIDLDAIAGSGPTRIAFAGDRSRFPSPTLLATTAARVVDQSGDAPRRPSAFGQLLDLAFPFSFYEQAPMLGRGLSALTLTSAGERPPDPSGDTPDQLSSRRLGEIGRTAQQLLGSLDEGIAPVQATSSYVYFGARIVRGWAIAFVLVAALLPFLTAVVDLFALARRRHLPLAPALRSLRSRIAFWLWVALVFALFGLAGAWPHGSSAPPAPEASSGTDWPVVALALFAGLSAVGWLVGRDRLIPRRAVTLPEELTGHCAALLALAVVALLTVALNTFALVFLLPSLHAWLWLPQVARRSGAARLGVWLAGLAGPALLMWDFAVRFGLGFDAPWYLLQLAALNQIPLAVLAVIVVWLAAAAQLAALAAHRYAPYPSASERPPLGPMRRAMRRLVVASRTSRRHLRVVEDERAAADSG